MNRVASCHPNISFDQSNQWVFEVSPTPNPFSFLFFFQDPVKYLCSKGHTVVVGESMIKYHLLINRLDMIPATNAPGLLGARFAVSFSRCLGARGDGGVATWGSKSCGGDSGRVANQLQEAGIQAGR